MPEELDKFLDAAHDAGVDQTILDSTPVQNALNGAKRYGEDVLDGWAHHGKSKAETPAPASQTPTAPETPEGEKRRTVFDNMSFGVHGLSSYVKYKPSDDSSSVFSVDRSGIGGEYRRSNEHVRYTIGAERNIFSSDASTSLYGSVPSELQRYGVSFSPDSLNAGASFSNRSGFSAAVSGNLRDNQFSAGVGYTHPKGKYNVDVNAGNKGVLATFKMPLN